MFVLIFWRPGAAVLHEAVVSKLTRQAAVATFRQLQLRHNPPLFGERRERDFDLLNEIRRNASLARRASEVFLCCAANRRLREKAINIVRANTGERTDDVKFGRAASDSIPQSSGNRAFAVLHARRDLSEQHIALCEMREPFTNLAKSPLLQRLEFRFRFTQRGHSRERDEHGIIETLGMPWIDFGNLSERRGRPPFRQFVAYFSRPLLLTTDDTDFTDFFLIRRLCVVRGE